MKQLLSVILISILITGFSVQKFDSHELTQMVITLPGLNTEKLQRDIENDIQNLPGIKFIDTSLSSKTLIIHYESRKLSPYRIGYVIQKWGCHPGESTYHSVVAVQ